MTMSGAPLHLWDHRGRILSPACSSSSSSRAEGDAGPEMRCWGAAGRQVWRGQEVCQLAGPPGSQCKESKRQRELSASETEVCFSYFTVTTDENSTRVEGSVGVEAAGEPLIFFFFFNTKNKKLFSSTDKQWRCHSTSSLVTVWKIVSKSWTSLLRRESCVFLPGKEFWLFEMPGLFPDALIYKCAPRCE